MDSITLKAYAKINLALDVLRRRTDGYHDVRMVMQTIKLYDKLTMKKTVSPAICLNTNLSYLPLNENNLVYAAIKLFKDTFHITEGVFAELNKRIPVAAGMAGGSADAAAALLGMDKIFGTNLPLSKLMELGSKLGADVPYCLMGGTVLAEGIGEILTPLAPAPSCCCLIVKPSISVSTKHVYEHLILNEYTNHGSIDAMLTAIKTGSINQVASSLFNVLESVTIKEHPEIQEIKNQMLSFSALGTLMSGSGPSVFGLFANKQAAHKAFYEFKVGKFGNQTFLAELHQPERV